MRTFIQISKLAIAQVNEKTFSKIVDYFQQEGGDTEWNQLVDL